METNKRHPFSYTLGPGPYHFVRLVQIKLAEGRPVQVWGKTDDIERGVGTCAHCSHGIMDNYIVQTGEGKKFPVGSDCIMKIHAEGDFSNLSDFERTVRALKRKKGQEAREKKREQLEKECAELVNKNLEKLANAEHPGRFPNGRSFKDYAIWYTSRKNTLGGLKLFKKKVMEILTDV